MTSAQSPNDRIFVAARVRPLLAERPDGYAGPESACEEILHVDSERHLVELVDPNPQSGQPPRIFKLNCSFKSEADEAAASQHQVWQEIKDEVLGPALSGHSVGVVAYGPRLCFF